MYIQKYERILIKIGIGLLLIGGIIEGIRWIREGEQPELKNLKPQRIYKVKEYKN